ncbi:MAG TPA: arginine--tRNA ligase [Alphaproteobacteria bacterium]|nr:arginine--tRNA ligase [Alphaproteobacteria bacterium]
MDIFSRFADFVTVSVHQLIEDGQVTPRQAVNTEKLVVELPREESHGDLACNAAMVLAKQVGMAPRDLAGLLADKLAAHEDIAAVDIAGPGFLNITLKPGVWPAELTAILSAGSVYGQSDIGSGQAVNVEFVSANPTGPLHAAHARGAIFGDALANLLAFCGFQVTREYYINDAGAQVDTLARSAFLRYREALGEEGITIPEGLYPGEYLKDVGEALKARYQDSLRDQPEVVTLPIVRSFAIDAMMDGIKADLRDLGIEMDVFSSERHLVEQGRVDEAMGSLRDRGLVYRGVLAPPKGQLPDDWEEREQLLFRATEFGDDTDRPLQKSDGSWTYFASDVAYHADKLNRTGGALINVWGADHGGYVKRMTAATQALSEQNDMLDVKLCQLVTLLDKGKPVKMSKRAGTFVTLRDVMETVGADVMRFIMLTRRNDQTLEFDYAKVTEKSRENPVFYVQYAHARASSVLRQEDIRGLTEQRQPDLALLSDMHEVRLIKQLASWPSVVRAAALTHEPHRVAFYLIDLAALFHGLWNAGRDNPALRFILDSNAELTRARLSLVAASAHVIKAGLSLLSVDAPEEM